MLFNSKRKAASDASAAAALIAIIAALIVLYILFLPPEERQKILNEDGDSNANLAEGEIKELLSASPQTLYPPEKKEFERSFPAVNLYVGEEGIEAKKVDSIYVSRSLFGSKKTNFSFKITNINDIKDALLNFYVDQSKGRLIVTLNGKEVFNKDLAKGNIQPIDLKERLIEGANDIQFEVSSPGIAFWRKNQYSLSNILITTDVLRREAQESEFSFVVDSTERDNLKKVKLHFFPECIPEQVGALTIWLNSYTLYSSVPDCGSPNQAVEFLPDRLAIGDNKLVFRTDRGKYLIDNIRLSSELKEAIIPVYYFELTKEQLEDVQNNEANTTLYMKFTDDTGRKVADLLLNNHAIRLDQYEIEFKEDISKIVEKGNNALKIEPDEPLSIVELKVELES